MSEALKAWAARGQIPLLLPSGTRVRLHPRSAVEVVREGRIPAELRARAMQYETGGWDPKSMSEEERMQSYDFMRSFIAQSIVGVEVDGIIEDVTLEAADLVNLPEADITMIQDVITLRKTPRQAQTESEAALGITTEADAKKVADAEAAGTLPGWAPFRNGSGGDPAGSDGGEVREIAGAGLPQDR